MNEWYLWYIYGCWIWCITNGFYWYFNVYLWFIMECLWKNGMKIMNNGGIIAGMCLLSVLFCFLLFFICKICHFM